jgi:hypothetical protein
VDQSTNDAGRQANKRRMRLLRTVGRPELVAPVVQRNIGVWLALGLIVVIVGLDMVGGRNAGCWGCWSARRLWPPRSWVPNARSRLGWSRWPSRSATAGRSGWTCWPAPRGCPRSRSGSRPCCRGWWRECGWSGKGGCGRSPGSPRSPSGRCWAGCPGVGEPAPGRAVCLGQHRGVNRGGLLRGTGDPARGTVAGRGRARQGPGRGPAGRGGAGQLPGRRPGPP